MPNEMREDSPVSKTCARLPRDGQGSVQTRADADSGQTLAATAREQRAAIRSGDSANPVCQLPPRALP